MSSWWVTKTLDSGGPIELFSWCFWVILSITLHELGHGIAAIWQGDRTPIEKGHMNMNPMVHMGPYSLLIFAIIGIAWGAMPVTPYRFRMGRLGDALVSLAGPLVNLILAFLTATLLGITIRYGNHGSNFTDNFIIFLQTGAMLNMLLLIFNLLPVPPLDGSRILAGLFRAADHFYQKPEVQQFGMLALLVLLFSNINKLWTFADYSTYWWAKTVLTILS